MKSTKKDKMREELMAELATNYILVPRKHHKSRPEEDVYRILNTVIDTIRLKRLHDHEFMKSKLRCTINGYKLPESRHIFYWIVGKIDDMITWNSMAKYIKKNHATAMHGFRQVENWIQTDKVFRDHVLEICDHYINSVQDVDTTKLKNHISQFK